MFNDVTGDLLPSAVAVALSPIPVIAVVLVLGSPRARVSGPLFAAGWVAGLATASALVVLVLGAATTADPDLEDSGVAWLKLALAVMFIVMGAGQWRKRPAPGEEAKMPGWMATVDTATPGRAVVLGFLLSAANPKNLALVIASAATIAESGLDGADKAFAVAVFIAIGSASVVGAVAVKLAGGQRAAAGLNEVRAFMAQHNAVIMMVVLVLLGAKFAGDALAGI